MGQPLNPSIFQFPSFVLTQNKAFPGHPYPVRFTGLAEFKTIVLKCHSIFQGDHKARMSSQAEIHGPAVLVLYDIRNINCIILQFILKLIEKMTGIYLHGIFI